MSNKVESKSNLESKRAQFTEQNEKKNPVKIIAILAIVLLLVVAGYFAVNGVRDNQASGTVTKTTDAIKISIADLDSGKVQFLNHQLANNTEVRFFAVKSPDGKFRAAMDACDTCFHAKKGYRQEGDVMVCNNCSMKFQNNLINEVKGGCNPVGVICTVEGDQLVIQTSELESRGRYFQ